MVLGCRRRLRVGADGDELDTVVAHFDDANRGRTDTYDVPLAKFVDFVIRPLACGVRDLFEVDDREAAHAGTACERLRRHRSSVCSKWRSAASRS
jgi:hypothetical protein